MYSKILILRFPQKEVQKPIVYHLVKDFNLIFNILNARILPRREGVMVMELTGTDISSHSKLGADLVREMGVSEAVAHAVLCHNEAHGFPRETQLDKGLFCADPLTGLITAAALIRPDKKLGNLEARSVKKRFKEKDFAAGANREQIAQCKELGLEIDEFIELGLKAMQGIAGDLGL